MKTNLMEYSGKRNRQTKIQIDKILDVRDTRKNRFNEI